MTSRATAGGIDPIISGDTSQVGIFAPQIGILADGGWIALFSYDDGTNTAYDVFQQRYDASGVAVGLPQTVNALQGGDQYANGVVGLVDGGWLSLWTDNETGSVSFQRFDASGDVVGGQVDLRSSAGPDDWATGCALASGGWVVSWRGFTFGIYRIYQQAFDANGSAIGSPTQVVDVSGEREAPSVAALGDGGWVVAYAEVKGGTAKDIFLQRYGADGLPVGSKTPVNSTLSGDQVSPRVCVLADGTWVVTWQGYNGVAPQVYLQHFDIDGTRLGGEVIVNQITFNSPVGNYDCDVVALRDGGWVVVYKQDLGGPDHIIQQRYDSAGNPVGGATTVDGGLDTLAMTPRVAATADGGWDVVWLGETTNIRTLYQRHYAPDILGTAGADTLAGTSWGERIVGAAGNDTLGGSDGEDTLVGGYGDDTYIVNSAGDRIEELALQGIDTVRAGITFTLAGLQVENLVLTGGSAIDGTGNDSANIITGNNAANQLGGAGGADRLIGNGGNDTLRGAAGNDTLIGGAGNDRLEGGNGLDTASYAGATGAVVVSLALNTAQATGGAGSDTLIAIENLIGAAFGDPLTGNDLANVIEGAGGDDALDGGAGNDTASYASANGAVTVSLALAGAQATGGAGTDTLVRFENLLGSRFGDTLTGNAQANVLEGGGGNDTLDGGGGADTASYAGASGRVDVSLSLAGPQNTLAAGTDTLISIENLIGSNFADSLAGDSNANRLDGGRGDDQLDGGIGADSLTGGFGFDQMVGGSGADRFIFADGHSGAAAGRADIIFDFSQVDGDKIDLSAIDANTGASGNQAFTFIGSGAFTSSAGQLRYATDHNYGYVYVEGDVDGDGIGDFRIYSLASMSFSVGDFVL